jgi:hypothetical protein
MVGEIRQLVRSNPTARKADTKGEAPGGIRCLLNWWDVGTKCILNWWDQPPFKKKDSYYFFDLSYVMKCEMVIL